MKTATKKIVYTVRHFDPVRRKHENTRWKMTEEEASARYAGQEYEILRGTREERHIPADPQVLRAGHLQRGFCHG